MPALAPPADLLAAPVLCTLPAGAALWRVHDEQLTDRIYTERGTAPVGRFDGSYPFCYAALSRAAALIERFARHVPYPGWTERVLPRRAVRGQFLSTVEPVDDLLLVSLQTEPDLAAVRQDAWLVRSEPDHWAATAAWADWIRRVAPAASGFIWPAKRDTGGRAVVLFGDRCTDLVLAGLDQPVPLSGTAGVGVINRELEPYGLVVHPPA